MNNSPYEVGGACNDHKTQTRSARVKLGAFRRLLLLFSIGLGFSCYSQTLSTPTVPSGLQAWYRADLGVTKDGSNNVSQWADQSGNGVHLSQNTATAQPLWVANGFNGEPTVSFNGSSDILTSLSWQQTCNPAAMI